MPTLPLDPYTTLFIVGLLHMIMPLTVWTLLTARHDVRSASLWCGGAALSGLSYLLYSLSATLPGLSLELANAIACFGFAMRWSALRIEQGAGARLVPALALAAAAAAGHAVLHGLGGGQLLSYNVITQGLASALVAHQALQLARASDSRSARMIALTYAALSAALLLRGASLLSGTGSPQMQSLDLDRAAVLLTGMLSALWGNIGYLGFALETTARRESASSAELALVTSQREQAQAQAERLKALSDERQELLRVISHEARQPLHNAQAVLQSVESALRSGPGDQAVARIARARGVLRQITATLDNTLAVSTLVVDAQQAPTPPRDADIDMLVQVALGDLPPESRERVHVQRLTGVRTAAFDMGLMRLALRNLLGNAIAYATPGSPVTLRIADSDEPLALVFEVEDTGPGIAPDLEPHLFERGRRGRHDTHGQGLGLYIVRRAMQRQGGSVDHRPGTLGGALFRLTVPQGVEPAADPDQSAFSGARKT